MKHSIIPLFIPHYGCPHQCIFCNQVRITGMATPVTAGDVEKTIRTWTASARRFWEAAFYGGSFTALPENVMRSLLLPAKEALRKGEIRAIRLSTRPDCITEDILALLKEYGVTTVELGAQSLDDQVLTLSERGHKAEDIEKAVRLLQKEGFHTGLQLMTGLPGEDGRSLRYTARKAAALRPDFVRLYPVLVLKDTKLGRMYERGQYQPLTVDEAVFRCAFLKRWYRKKGIPVIRTGLQATEELDRGDSLLAGPYHAALGERADQYNTRHTLKKALRSWKGEEVLITCSRKDRSKIMGYRRSTWEYLEKTLSLRLSCREDESLPQGEVHLEKGKETRRIFLEGPAEKIP